jgi:hypothetical protein
VSSFAAGVKEPVVRAGQRAALAQEEVRRMGQTIAEFLREEGKKEGKLLAVREVLLRLLRDRFGRVPKAVRQKIEATAEVELLQACVLQATKINSVDELLLRAP